MGERLNKNDHGFMPTAMSVGTIFFLLFGTAVIYWPGLNGPLILDDVENLRPLEHLVEGKLTLTEMLGNETRQASSLLQGVPRRPLALLSFGVNAMTTGLSVWHLKFTNLAIHLLCGLMVCWLILRLLAQEGPQGVQARRYYVAILAMALWLLSPMFVSTTLYVVQRMAQLSTLFVLISLLAYVIGRQNIGRNSFLGIGLIVLSYVVLFPLAVAAKENALVFPLLAILTEVTFFSAPENRRGRRIVWGIHVLVVSSGIMALLAYLFGETAGGQALATDLDKRPFTMLERVMTQGRVLVDYLRNILLPQGYRMGVYWDDYQLSKGLFTPITTLLALMFWVVTATVSLFLLRTRWRLPAYGLLFFLVAHSIEAGPLPLELYFEHRNYLPGVGIYFALSVLVVQFSAQLPRRRLAIVPVVFFVSLFAFATAQRVNIWVSPELIMRTAVVAHPTSPRLLGDLATLSASQGNLPEAMSFMDRAEKVRGGGTLASALHRILLQCRATGRVSSEALNALYGTRAVHDNAYTTTALRHLVETGLASRCKGLDSGHLAQHIQSTALGSDIFGNRLREWLMYVFTGKLYLFDGNGDGALWAFSEAMTTWPERPEPGLIALKLLIDKGQGDEARELLARLRRLPLELDSQAASRLEELARMLNELSRH